MYPVFFNLGPLTVRSYGLFLVLAFVFGTYLVWKEGRRGGYNEEKLLDYAVVVLLSALIVGRLWYVILNLAFFVETPLSVLALWQGGFAYHGALLGGIFGGYLYVKKVKWPFFQIADFSVIAVCFSSGIAKIGAFLAGSDFGSPTSLPWGVLFTASGQIGRRHPVQIYEAIFFFGLFFILKALDQRKKKSGGIFFFYLMLTGVGRWFFEFFRGDSTYFGVFKAAQVVSVVVVLIGAVGLYYFSRRDWKSDLRKLLFKFEDINWPVLGLNKKGRKND